MFWIIVAILTALVALVLIWPLARRPQAAHSDELAPQETSEIAVYQDQLRELDRERESGLIGQVEADYARAEIGRRLIAASDLAEQRQQSASPSRGNRWLANGVLLALPVLGLCLYLSLGNPDRPDMPLEARLENPGDNLDLMLAKIERHLSQNPDDGRGWDVVAPVYFKAGRLSDAQNAFRNAIRLDGETVARLTGLGESLVNANDGIVVDEARALFQRVLMVEPQNPRAQYYSGLAAQQSGQVAQAKQIFTTLAENSPKDAPWLPLVKQHLSKLEDAPTSVMQPAPVTTPALKGPSVADVEAAAQLSGEDRKAMILSMVEGLEAKLKDEPKNIDGWLQLLRSYGVLGEKDKAQAALGTALQVYALSNDERKRLLEMARALGLSELGGVQ